MTKEELEARQAERTANVASWASEYAKEDWYKNLPPPHLYAPGELEELQAQVEVEAARRPRVVPVTKPIDWDRLTPEEKIAVAGGDITGSDEELARRIAEYDAAEAEIEATFDNPPQNTDG